MLALGLALSLGASGCAFFKNPERLDAAEQQQLKSSLNVASASADAGQFAAAERLYRELSRHYPDAAEPRLGLGYLAMRSGDFNLAGKLFAEAEERSATPGSKAAALLGAGRANLGQDDVAGAKKEFLAASELAKDTPAAAWVANGLGVVATLEGDHALARKHYEEADRLSSSHPMIAANLIRALAQSGETAEARRLYARHSASHWLGNDAADLSKLLEEGQEAEQPVVASSGGAAAGSGSEQTALAVEGQGPVTGQAEDDGPGDTSTRIVEEDLGPTVIREPPVKDGDRVASTSVEAGSADAMASAPETASETASGGETAGATGAATESGREADPAALSGKPATAGLGTTSQREAASDPTATHGSGAVSAPADVAGQVAASDPAAGSGTAAEPTPPGIADQAASSAPGAASDAATTPASTAGSGAAAASESVATSDAAGTSDSAAASDVAAASGSVATSGSETPSVPAATAGSAVASAATGAQVQVYAARTEAGVLAAWGRLSAAEKDLLGSLNPDVVKNRIPGKGVFYRLRAGPLANKAAAKRLCRLLKGRGRECFVPLENWAGSGGAGAVEVAAGKKASGAGVLVQLHAANSRAAALAAWKRLSRGETDLLGSLAPRVVKVQIPKQVFYRLFAGPFPDVTEAGRVCGTLKGRGRECFVRP